MTHSEKVYAIKLTRIWRAHHNDNNFSVANVLTFHSEWTRVCKQLRKEK